MYAGNDYTEFGILVRNHKELMTYLEDGMPYDEGPRGCRNVLDWRDVLRAARSTLKEAVDCASCSAIVLRL